MEMARLIQAVFIGLPSRVGDNKSDSDWTLRLKEEIAELGRTHEWDICTSGFKDRFDCEWLYDLIWYKNDSADHLSELYLVLESEWDIARSAIKYDFEKLLIARATLKVMVFQAYNRDISKIFELLKAGIDAFHTRSDDEIYILAGFNIDSFAFDVRIESVASVV